MWKTLSGAVLCLFTASTWAGADLTPTERTWLRAAVPVLNYAQSQQLPLDIVVQPQDAPGAAPLAMAFLKGRCKLVLSMRGNPAADTALTKIAPELLSPTIEAMAAHELGHCWRHLQGAWAALPAGFAETSSEPGAESDQNELVRDMRQTRREEGFSDLVGLAWTLQHHPEHYQQVQAWFERVRADQPVAGAHHDTRTWVRLAKDRTAFASTGSLFEQAQALWQAGLIHQD